MSYLDNLPRRVKITIAFSSTLITVAVVTLAVILFLPFLNQNDISDLEDETVEVATEEPAEETPKEEPVKEETPAEEPTPVPSPTVAPVSGVCPTTFGKLMLINPNFKVSEAWIANRRTQLINITEQYGIREGNRNNGTPLLDAEAAVHLNEMLTAYTNETGGEMVTRSCFRSKGTNCGRLCYATGTSDHHTGYTCDLIDNQYGSNLDTDYYNSHLEWQWLKANSYKYGFIDRFPAEWAGGPMSQPVNVDANGTTGLYETWHYRYVGVTAATEIATGKYNNGKYDSLEHYLKAIGKIPNLLGPAVCE